MASKKKIGGLQVFNEMVKKEKTTNKKSKELKEFVAANTNLSKEKLDFFRKSKKTAVSESAMTGKGTVSARKRRIHSAKKKVLSAKRNLSDKDRKDLRSLREKGSHFIR